MTTIDFVKMHGAGNDYIYIDCLNKPLPENPEALSRKLADRHTGIGGDGVVLICPPEKQDSDATMRMFNLDGSESEMCGNAIRCVAKYLYDRKIVPQPEMTIDTGRGPLFIKLETENGTMLRSTVNMMEPVFESAKIPTTLAGDPPVMQTIDLDGQKIPVTCVSTGNPHAIIFVDEPTDDWVLWKGPKLETHPAFPARANIEFVQILGPNEVRMRVWERGSGETMACGTGACAVCVAGVLNGKTERRIVAHLPGGDLELFWNEEDNCVYMTGPATEVFSGSVIV